MKSLLCFLGWHKFVIKRKIKGCVKGEGSSPLRGVFLIYECSRCNKKQKAEFISLTERRTVQTEYIEAYAKEE